MRLFTAVWSEAKKTGQKTFHTRTQAVEFAREKVQSENCGAASIWRYTITGPVLGAIAKAHDGAEWWTERKYEGTVLKSGKFTRS
jgi:hypothetical protein